MGVASMAIQIDPGRRLGMATTVSFASTGFAAGVLIGSLTAGVIAADADAQYVFFSAVVAVLRGCAVFVLRTIRPMTELAPTGEVAHPPVPAAP